MRVPVETLQAFYTGRLGRVARDMSARRLQAIWPDLSGDDVLAFGYCTPLLQNLPGTPRRIVSAMPGGQGCEIWPGDGPNASVLSDEERLPFRDAMFDRVLLAHALEDAENPARLLREIWRVSAPEARLLIIVANRRGLWSRTDATPFGHGRPFSRSQLHRFLSDALWRPTAYARAVYAPPLSWPIIAKAADAWEQTGERFWPRFGGLLMVEAIKRVEITPDFSSAAPVASPVSVGARPLSRDDDATGCANCRKECASDLSDNRH